MEKETCNLKKSALRKLKRLQDIDLIMFLRELLKPAKAAAACLAYAALTISSTLAVRTLQSRVGASKPAFVRIV